MLGHAGCHLMPHWRGVDQVSGGLGHLGAPLDELEEATGKTDVGGVC